MSEQQLTYESVLKLIRGNSRDLRKTRRLMKERDAEYAREKQERDAEYAREKKERDAEYAREKKERDAEFDKIRQETALQIKETNKKIGALGNRIGDIIEHMLGERIIEKFQALGYAVDDYTRNHRYRNSKLGISGEIDLILHDGDIAIFIGVKTKLETADVRRHLEQMEQYRRHADAVGILWPPSTRFIGAVAGAVVDDEAMKFAHENGLYTIVQSGEAVEIVPTPEGFKVREW